MIHSHFTDSKASKSYMNILFSVMWELYSSVMHCWMSSIIKYNGVHLQDANKQCAANDLILWNKVSELSDLEQLVLTANWAQILMTSVVVLSLHWVSTTRHGGTIIMASSNDITVVVTEHGRYNFVIITIL